MTTQKYIDPKTKLLDPRFRDIEPAVGDCACTEMQVRKIDEASRTVDAVVSTAEVDRYEEIVEPRAFKKWLKHFKANPVMLAAHEHSAWSTAEPTVIGKWLDIQITPDAVLAKAQFMPDDALAEKYWRRYRDGYMKAFSVGFIAHSWEMREFDVDGGKAKKRLRVFTEAELLEISPVAVPANRGALARAASFFGAPAADQPDATKALGDVFVRLLSDPDGPVPRALEELLQRRVTDHEGLDYFEQHAPPPRQAPGIKGLDLFKDELKAALRN